MSKEKKITKKSNNTKKSNKSVKEKKDNISLIITEKPQAAKKIAAALSKNKDVKYQSKDKGSYYEFQRDGRTYVVGCAVGHLFGIQQKELRGPLPNFNV